MIDKQCTLHRIITKEYFSTKMLDDLHFMKKNPTNLVTQNWLLKLEYDNKEYLQKKKAEKSNNAREKQQRFQELLSNNGLFSLSLQESSTSLYTGQLSICLENQEEKENKEILCPFTVNEMIKQLKSYDELINVKVELESLQLFQGNETYKYRNKSELTKNLDQANPLNKYNTFIHDLEEKYTQEIVINRNDCNWLDMEVKNVIEKIQWSKAIILKKLMELNQNVTIVEEANLEKYIENLVDEIKKEQLDESFNLYITDKAYFYGLGINALYFDPVDQIIYVWKHENKHYVYLDKNKFLVTIILQNNIGIFQHAHFAINDMPFQLCLRCQKHFEKEGYINHLCAKEIQTMDKCQNQILIKQILKREQQNSEVLQNDL